MSTTADPPEHRGAVAVLGPPGARNRTSWVIRAVKSGVACLLALLVDGWVGNPDHVTSTFVAVLCVSPVVLLGVRRARDQVAGSLLGGAWGTVFALVGLPPLAGVPLAVAAGILTSFLLGFERGYAIAAFTALFVQVVPRGGPLDTLEIRLLAVGIGVLVASLVNVVASAFAYRSIFERRLRQAESTVSRLLIEAARRGPEAAHAGFPLIAELEHDLAQARGELVLRRDETMRTWVEAVAERVAALRLLLHLVVDLDYRLREEALSRDTMQPWLAWLVREGGEEPEVPVALRATTRRIRRLGRDLRERERLGPAPAVTAAASIEGEDGPHVE